MKARNFDPLTWTAGGSDPSAWRVGEWAERDPKKPLPIPAYSVSSKLLQEADAAISSDRKAAYGNCGPSFERISFMWNTWMEVTGHTSLTPEDVAMMMALFKAARIAYNPNSRDSYVDMIGYVALAGEMSLRTEDAK
jgi:hypothetical protein